MKIVYNKPVLYPEEGHSDIRAGYLSDPTYKEMLTYCAVVCVDVVPVDYARQKLYLAKRIVKPAKDWLWALGGRINAFEHEDDAAVRFLLEDAGLKVDPEQIRFIKMNRYWWNEIAQQDVHGSDNLCFTYVVELTDIERNSVVLSKKEYDAELGLVAVGREDLDKVSQPMKDLFYAVFGE